MQDILATLIGAHGKEHAEAPGFGKVILANLNADEALVRAELDRHRVPAIVRATIDEIVCVRAASLRRPIYDRWSHDKRDRVSSWLQEMGLAGLSDGSPGNWQGVQTGGLGTTSGLPMVRLGFRRTAYAGPRTPRPSMTSVLSLRPCPPVNLERRPSYGDILGLRFFVA